jgi:hypothetical protein
MTSQVRPRWTKPVRVIERPVRRNDRDPTAYLIRDSGATGLECPRTHREVRMYGCNRSCFVTPGACTHLEDTSWRQAPAVLPWPMPQPAGIGHASAYLQRAASRVRCAGLRPPLTRSRGPPEKYQRQLPTCVGKASMYDTGLGVPLRSRHTALQCCGDHPSQPTRICGTSPNRAAMVKSPAIG